MTLEELKILLNQLYTDCDGYEVVFGECYPNFPVETIQVIGDQVIISM